MSTNKITTAADSNVFVKKSGGTWKYEDSGKTIENVGELYGKCLDRLGKPSLVTTKIAPHSQEFPFPVEELSNGGYNLADVTKCFLEYMVLDQYDAATPGGVSSVYDLTTNALDRDDKTKFGKFIDSMKNFKSDMASLDPVGGVAFATAVILTKIEKATTTTT